MKVMILFQCTSTVGLYRIYRSILICISQAHFLLYAYLLDQESVLVQVFRDLTHMTVCRSGCFVISASHVISTQHQRLL